MLSSVSDPGFEIHGQGHPKIVYVQAYPYQGRGSYPQGAQPETQKKTDLLVEARRCLPSPLERPMPGQERRQEDENYDTYVVEKGKPLWRKSCH